MNGVWPQKINKDQGLLCTPYELNLVFNSTLYIHHYGWMLESCRLVKVSVHFYLETKRLDCRQLLGCRSRLRVIRRELGVFILEWGHDCFLKHSLFSSGFWVTLCRLFVGVKIIASQALCQCQLFSIHYQEQFCLSHGHLAFLVARVVQISLILLCLL